MFQSSPALKDRCNPALPDSPRWMVLVSILTGLERPVQQAVARLHKLHKEFQSSPALKDRCNVGGVGGVYGSGVVSILTGLERPVQPGGARRVVFYILFQSSPALKDRCNGTRGWWGLWFRCGFNPHRP